MPVTTAQAAARVASCNDLLYAIDRLEVILNGVYDPTDDHVRKPRVAAMHVWIGNAREIVLDIKASL